MSGPNLVVSFSIEKRSQHVSVLVAESGMPRVWYRSVDRERFVCAGVNRVHTCGGHIAAPRAPTVPRVRVEGLVGRSDVRELNSGDRYTSFQ